MSRTSSSSSSSGSDTPKNTSLKRKVDASDDVDDSDSDSNAEASEDESAKSSSEALKKRTSTERDVGGENEESTEVDVLSHAAKRHQKKRQKLEQNASSNANVKSTKSKDKAKKPDSSPGQDKEKRQNSVWVGNLSFKTTPENLRSFFEGVGEITRVHMPMKLAPGGADKQKGKWPAAAAKENRGFAYVDFATPEAKKIAITCSEKNLDGRRLLIKDGDDFTGRPAATPSTDTAEGSSKASSSLSGHSKTAQKILNAQKQPPGPTLFLGNLGFETTTENITEMIIAHHRAAGDKTSRKKEKNEDLDDDGDRLGEGQGDAAKKEKSEAGIRKVRMGTFEDSGLCKGFAFVDFISVEHATAVLINPRNHKLNGRQLVVEYASPDAVRRGGHREKGAGAGAPRGHKKFATTKGESRGRSNEKDGSAMLSNQSEVTDEAIKEGENSFKGRKNERGSMEGYAKRRPKPGAALALAKRENVAIVPSEGTRITF